MGEALERGEICFFFRPTVRPADEPETEVAVQSFFAVLSPEGSDLHRRVRVGRKRMPAPSGERFWAVVERVGSLSHVLSDQRAERYATKTRGERYQPGARPIARGRYAFVQHEDHVHLVYRIGRREEGAPSEADVADAASYVVLFERVPQTSARWTTEGLPGRLDHEDAELILVGIDDEPERQLGMESVAAF
jgi:hypothetical protein